MIILIIVTCKQETIHRGIVLLDLRQDTGDRRSTSFVARLVLEIGAGDHGGRNTGSTVIRQRSNPVLCALVRSSIRNGLHRVCVRTGGIIRVQVVPILALAVTYQINNSLVRFCLYLCCEYGHRQQADRHDQGQKQRQKLFAGCVLLCLVHHFSVPF